MITSYYSYMAVTKVYANIAKAYVHSINYNYSSDSLNVGPNLYNMLGNCFCEVSVM